MLLSRWDYRYVPSYLALSMSEFYKVCTLENLRLAVRIWKGGFGIQLIVFDPKEYL
jgi:hypothetical protein